MQVAPCWPLLLSMLLPIVQSVERKETSDNEPILIVITLQQICEVDKQVAALIKAHIFPEAVYDVCATITCSRSR